MGDFGQSPFGEHGEDNDTSANTNLPGPPRDQEAIQRAEAQGWTQGQVDAPSQHTFMANAARYVWSDEYGDVGPAIPELEANLFNAASKLQQGQRLQE